MKEVEKVSLGGYAFTLDEDAARLAADYLGELERHYAGREGGSEILEGIEERMAELVREKCGRDGVASRAIIEEIIGILGRPEDIESEEDEDSRPGAAPSGTEPQTRRKLYRDVSDKVIAGVCSGLGVYFNLDKVLFRLIFAILTLLPLLGLNSRHGFSWQVELLSPALYLVLWICMPPARTARQRWEQRGEDGTIHGIQQRVENGAREAGEALHSVGKSNAWSEIGRIFEKLVGVVLLILGFGGLKLILFFLKVGFCDDFYYYHRKDNTDYSKRIGACISRCYRWYAIGECVGDVVECFCCRSQTRGVCHGTIEGSHEHG